MSKRVDKLTELTKEEKQVNACSPSNQNCAVFSKNIRLQVVMKD